MIPTLVITFLKPRSLISETGMKEILGATSTQAKSIMSFAVTRLGNSASRSVISCLSTQSARNKSAFAIVGDTGNPTGDEGSLHLLQDLGYPFHDGKHDAVEKPEIVIRFYPNSNPRHQFFFTQPELDQAAAKLGLSRDFSTAPSNNR